MPLPAHIIYGDNFLVSIALKGFEAQVGLPDVLEANSHHVMGAQVDFANLQGLCSAVPFLADYRLVVVEGLLSTSDPAEGRRRASGRQGSARNDRGASRQKQQSEWKELPRYIVDEMPTTTLLVLLEGTLPTGNVLFQSLQKVCEVHQSPTPTGEALARWIRNQVSEKGSQITPGAIRYLSQLVGPDLRTLNNELEKLSLYVQEKPIEEEDVRRLVAQAKEASIFAAVDALLAGRSSVCLPLIHDLREDGAEFPYILAMITRQVRLATLAKDLIDRGYVQKDIGEKLRLTHSFALQKTIEQARKHTWPGLRWLYRRLMRADLEVKRGQMEPDMVLDLLIGEVSTVVAGSRTR